MFSGNCNIQVLQPARSLLFCPTQATKASIWPREQLPGLLSSSPPAPAASPSLCWARWLGDQSWGGGLVSGRSSASGPSGWGRTVARGMPTTRTLSQGFINWGSGDSYRALKGKNWTLGRQFNSLEVPGEAVWKCSFWSQDSLTNAVQFKLILFCSLCYPLWVVHLIEKGESKMFTSACNKWSAESVVLCL